MFLYLKKGVIMEEYEISLIAKSVSPFIKYCEKNGYVKSSERKENRIVYENKHSRNIIARITTSWVDNKEQTFFDFKNKEYQEKNLKISQESMQMQVTDENRQIIQSFLRVLDFEKSADNLRVRYIYQKEKVTFEIDDYIRPDNNVIAIEGDKEQVDRIYKEIKELNLENQF